LFRPRERAFKQFKCPRPQCVTAWNIQFKSNNVRIIKCWQINTVFIVTLDMIRSVTVAALCIMLSWLWWTQKLSVKKNTKSLLWWSKVHCLVCQSKPKVKSIKTLPHKLQQVQTVSDWPLTPLPPTPPQSALQKVPINISSLIAPAEKSVFTHSRTEVEIEVEATNSVSEATFDECNYSKIPVIWLTWDWTSARLLVLLSDGTYTDLSSYM